MSRGIFSKNTFSAGLVSALATSLISSATAGEVRFGPPQSLQVPGLEKLEGPEVVDYDGDGVQDLLSGNYSGNILFRKNTGTNAAPKYADPVNLKRGEKDIKLKHW